MSRNDHRTSSAPIADIPRRRDLVFLDLEASGLELGSWPIQIGLARVHDDDSVSIDEELIRPDPAWDPEPWSSASEAVHGIARRHLDRAPEAREVAALAIDLLSGRLVVSDTPEFDRRWLHVLTATVDPDLLIPVRDFDHVLATSADLDGIRRAYAALEGLPRPHRAGEDAARLARAWLAAVER